MTTHAFNGSLTSIKLSVIIPCYNVGETVQTQLEALGRQVWSEGWEVIISDNGSTDNTIEVVNRYREAVPHLRIIDASARRGSAYARSIAAGAARGAALAFCDADDEVAPGWVAAIGNALFRYDLVASRQLSEMFTTTWVQRSYTSPQKDGLQKAWFPPYPSLAAASGLGVKKTLHENIGGFDESFQYLQDFAYCMKAQSLGAELCFVPDAIYHYRPRSRLSAMCVQSLRWSQYSILLYKRYSLPGHEIQRPWLKHLRIWGEVLKGLKDIRRREDFALWMWHLAWQVGQIIGWLRFRGAPVPWTEAEM